MDSNTVSSDHSAQQPRQADEIDRCIGRRMRDRRRMLGLSQQQVAELMGVTCQQVHKYEQGLNRLPVARLHVLVQALGVGVDYYYEGYGDEDADVPKQQQHMRLDLVRNFLAISDLRQQERLCQLARDLANQEAASQAAVAGSTACPAADDGTPTSGSIPSLRTSG
ncbi:MAG: helix-turn-helix domain-containing protein [Geminicoccaceae bacterium]